MEPPYATQEWLDAVAKVYRSNPKNKETFKAISMEICFRIAAEPRLGIEKDIHFNLKVEAGELLETRLVTAEEAQKATLLMGASYDTWKKVLTKKERFVTDFISKKIALEKGNFAKAFALGPVADPLVNIMTEEGIAWPDEMSPDELEAYKAKVKAFRQKLGV